MSGLKLFWGFHHQTSLIMVPPHKFSWFWGSVSQALCNDTTCVEKTLVRLYLLFALNSAINFLSLTINLNVTIACGN